MQSIKKRHPWLEHFRGDDSIESAKPLTHASRPRSSNLIRFCVWKGRPRRYARVADYVPSGECDSPRRDDGELANITHSAQWRRSARHL